MAECYADYAVDHPNPAYDVSLNRIIHHNSLVPS